MRFLYILSTSNLFFLGMNDSFRFFFDLSLKINCLFHRFVIITRFKYLDPALVFLSGNVNDDFVVMFVGKYAASNGFAGFLAFPIHQLAALIADDLKPFEFLMRWYVERFRHGS